MQSAHTQFNIKNITERLRVSLEELVLLGMSVVESSRAVYGRKAGMVQFQRLIGKGAELLMEEERSVSLKVAVEETLRAKSHRRPHTLREIRGFMERIMRSRSGLGRRMLTSFSSAEWQRIIEDVFESPRQRHKARVLLHGVYAVAYKRGWCRENVLARVDVPVVMEKTVPTLKVMECVELVEAARSRDYRDCLAPVSLMMYAGIRPHEVERLTWGNIDFEDKTILLRPNQTKTGGGRRITIEPVLHKILKEEKERLSRLSELVLNPSERSHIPTKLSQQKLENSLSKESIFKKSAFNQNLFTKDAIEKAFADKNIMARGQSMPLMKDRPICPPQWVRRWKDLRHSLGWNVNGLKKRAWPADCLRHTFASFHIFHYKDYTRLQYEMGHRSSDLLRTRYFNMDDLTTKDAQLFWKGTG